MRECLQGLSLSAASSKLLQKIKIYICVSLGQPCHNGESVRFEPSGESGGGSCGVWCFAAPGVNGGALNAIRCLKGLEFN